MSEVFLERLFDPPISTEVVLNMARASANCFGLYGVGWHGSLLSTDGCRMLCHFTSVDAESVRNALRQTGVDQTRAWPGTVHDAPGLTAADLAQANVAVERSWDQPVDLADVQAIEDREAWCLEAHKVSFIRTYFSVDRRRMICLYRAPDAESVRLAQSQAGMPFERAWAFRYVAPAGLPG